LRNPILAQTHITFGFSNLLGFGVSVSPKQVMAITLWMTGFLCLLNVALAVLYRARNRKEVISYYAACFFELAIFVFALLFFLGTITQSQIPYPLPPGLPINRAEMAAALAVGIGLFPAALWHRINLAELPKRIAADGKTMKQSAAGVRIKQPEEWMN
jgi:hypothetical protein